MKLTKWKAACLLFLPLLASACNLDWVWEPAPGPITNLSGTVILMDSVNRDSLKSPDPSGIPVLLTKEYYPYTVLDSTATDKNGFWKLSNVPSGDESLVITRPGFSAYVQMVHMPISAVYRFDTMQSTEAIGIAMDHAVILDSVSLAIQNKDSSYLVFGHDPVAASPPYGIWNILLCYDTARDIPAEGPHVSEILAHDYGEPETKNAGAFSNEMEVPASKAAITSDTLYFSAYALNPIEGEEHIYQSSPLFPGFRTCGPRSDVIAIPIH